ncbi:MAG: hypothetical protein ABIV25_06290 [Paracoccaceae bacterium]
MFSRTAIRMTAAAVLLAASALTAAATDRNVTIHNGTGVTIYRFYSTNSGASKWGGDVMGDSTLPDGSAMNLNFDNKYNYCNFDFRAEFSDGSVLEKDHVNVCEIGDYYYTE